MGNSAVDEPARAERRMPLKEWPGPSLPHDDLADVRAPSLRVVSEASTLAGRSVGMRRAESGAPPKTDAHAPASNSHSPCANTYAGVLSESHDNQKLGLVAAPTKIGLLASFVPALLLKELEKGANLKMPSSQQYEAVALFAVRLPTARAHSTRPSHHAPSWCSSGCLRILAAERTLCTAGRCGSRPDDGPRQRLLPKDD